MDTDVSNEGIVWVFYQEKGIIWHYIYKLSKNNVN